ncbi:MAG: transposase [Saprospiraceae bacterium]
MGKFKNQYRIESARLNDWDYRNAGIYFITICTYEHQHFFGKCGKGKMKLSTAGIIVQGCWYEIPRWNPHVELGRFIVMPNHLHGILFLDDYLRRIEDANSSQNKRDEDVFSNVSTVSGENEYYSEISSKSGSVSRMIQQFKSACTRHIQDVPPDLEFCWQERFHDHIIRNDAAFIRISDYIANNPANWSDDCFFSNDPS